MLRGRSPLTCRSLLYSAQKCGPLWGLAFFFLRTLTFPRLRPPPPNSFFCEVIRFSPTRSPGLLPLRTFQPPSDLNAFFSILCLFPFSKSDCLLFFSLSIDGGSPSHPFSFSLPSHMVGRALRGVFLDPPPKSGIQPLIAPGLGLPFPLALLQQSNTFDAPHWVVFVPLFFTTRLVVVN